MHCGDYVLWDVPIGHCIMEGHSSKETLQICIRVGWGGRAITPTMNLLFLMMMNKPLIQVRLYLTLFSNLLLLLIKNNSIL